MVRAAQRGIGAALVPIPIGELWFTEGSIVPLFQDEYVAKSSYYLVWTEDGADDESVILLKDWILDNFAE